MTEIRTTKIDGVEFVTLTDYLRLKEEKQELEYLGDINEELKEENKKLKEEVKDLVERDIELNKKYMIVLTENRKLEADRDERKRKEECSNVIIDFVKQQAREKGWTI